VNVMPGLCGENCCLLHNETLTEKIQIEIDVTDVKYFAALLAVHSDFVN